MTKKLKKYFTPEGCRLLVDDIVSETTLEHRAEKINVALVLDQKNRPRNTMGIVVAIGADPFLHETIEVQGFKRPRYLEGDEVCFDWHAGKLQMIEGHEFRSLEVQEITGCFRQVPDQDSEPELQSRTLSESELAAQIEQYRRREPTAGLSDTSYQEHALDQPGRMDLAERTADPVPSQSEPPQPRKPDWSQDDFSR